MGTLPVGLCLHGCLYIPRERHGLLNLSPKEISFICLLALSQIFHLRIHSGAIPVTVCRSAVDCGLPLPVTGENCVPPRTLQCGVTQKGTVDTAPPALTVYSEELRILLLFTSFPNF